MRTPSSPALALALLLALAGAARAGITMQAQDHLKCHKVKDTQAKAVYTADLTSVHPSFPTETGCSIKIPAKLVCSPTTKSITSQPAPPGSPAGLRINGDYACYKVKCPKSSFTVDVTDQFGSRTLAVKKPTMLCAPFNFD